MTSAHEPSPLRPDCPKCYGALSYPTPWIGFHAYMVACDCPAGAGRDDELRGKLPAGMNAHDFLDADGRPLRLWGGNGHRLGLLMCAGRVAWVDEGILPDIRRLWEHGIWTWVSCEGGEQIAPYVGLAQARHAIEAAGLLSWPVCQVYVPGARYVSLAEAAAMTGTHASLYGPHPPACSCMTHDAAREAVPLPADSRNGPGPD